MSLLPGCITRKGWQTRSALMFLNADGENSVCMFFSCGSAFSSPRIAKTVSLRTFQQNTSTSVSLYRKEPCGTPLPHTSRDSNSALPCRYPVYRRGRQEWTIVTVTQGGVSRDSAHLQRFNSKMLSISTGMPIGNVCTPSALRAGSLSFPNNVSKSSLAPLATCGCWVKDCSART
jgi:hypothetical protein